MCAPRRRSRLVFDRRLARRTRAVRSSVSVLWLVVGAAAAPALAQEEAAPDAPFQFVCLKESEPAFVNGMAVPVDETWERRDDVPAGRAPAQCWAWSDSCPPRLLEPGQNPAAACRSAGVSSRLLTVRIVAPEALDSNRAPVDGTAAPAEFSVTAAPAAMWRRCHDICCRRQPSRPRRSPCPAMTKLGAFRRWRKVEPRPGRT